MNIQKQKDPAAPLHPSNSSQAETAIINEQANSVTILAYLLHIIKELDQAVILCNESWQIVALSRGVAALLKMDTSSFKGGHLTRMIPLPSFRGFDSGSTQYKIFMEEVILAGGRPCNLKVSVNPIADEANKSYFLIFFNDVSDLVESQQAARTANLAKSQFLAQISHEIRTPLLSILGFCERLGGEKWDDKQREGLDTIEMCANQLLGLVNNLLDLTKIEAQRVEINRHPLNLKILMKQMLMLIKPQIEQKNLILELDWDSELPEQMVGDEGKLRQVLSNLLINAAKYTDRGIIKLSIRLDKKSLTPGSSSLPLLFSVADTGIGVDVHELDRIFEPFVQVDQLRKKQGNGLGLAICKQLVQIMGGNIWCEANYPRGAVFSFVLPLEVIPGSNQVSELKGQYLAPALQFPMSYRPTVLLAEDIKVNRKLIQYMLEDLGCKVFPVENGEKCINMLRKVTPDAILMDMQMPIMNGFEATRIIRQSEEWRYIPVVALTAYAMHGDVERCMEVGCNYYLSKPFTRNQLFDTLSQCLTSALTCD